MSVHGILACPVGREAEPFPAPEGVVELPLLLPGWQAEALEEQAHARGLTAGAMVRRLLSDFLSRSVSRSPKRRRG